MRGVLPAIYRRLIRVSGRSLGVSAIIPDTMLRQVLTLRSRLHGSWGFPGGAVQRGESIYEAVARECQEELGLEVDVLYLTGVYYVRRLDTHTCVFRCSLRDGAIRLSLEHSRFAWVNVETLIPEEQVRARDALDYRGTVSVRTLP